MIMTSNSKVGLHLHSCCSDGYDEPEALARKLKAAGAKIGMIADHDTAKAASEFVQNCNELGIIPVPGVEVTSKYVTPHGNCELHLLGFNINHEQSDAEELFRKNRLERNIRSLGSIRRLKQSRILQASYAKLVRLYGNFENCPSLMHIMDHLVHQEGLDFKTAREAVMDAEANGPGKDYSLILSWQEGIAAIRKLRGIPILAHPGELEKQFEGSPWVKRESLIDCIAEFARFGLRGMEVFHPKHTQKQEEEYMLIAKMLDLVVMSGSDYHGRHTMRKSITHHGITMNDVLDLLREC